jgi:hypothetical protein
MIIRVTRVMDIRVARVMVIRIIGQALIIRVIG